VELVLELIPSLLIAVIIQVGLLGNNRVGVFYLPLLVDVLVIEPI
jgi:hypothetical protein